MLLSSAMRIGEMTGDPQRVNDWFAGRQFGRWATQHRRPPAGSPPQPDAARTRRALDDLHRRGVIDDAELGRLRARMGV